MTQFILIFLILISTLNGDSLARRRLRRQILPSQHIQVHSIDSKVLLDKLINVDSTDSRVELSEKNLNGTIWAQRSKVQFDTYDTFVNATAETAQSIMSILNCVFIHGTALESQLFMRTNRTSDGHTYLNHQLYDNANVSLTDEGVQVQGIGARRIGIEAQTWEKYLEKSMTLSALNNPVSGDRELMLTIDAPLYHVDVCFVGAMIYIEFGDKLVQIDPDFRNVVIYSNRYTINFKTKDLATPYDVKLSNEEITIRCPQEQTTVFVQPGGVNVHVEEFSRMQLDRGGGEMLIGGQPLNADTVRVISLAALLSISNNGNVRADTTKSEILVQTPVQNVGLTAAHHDIQVLGGVPHLIVEAGLAIVEVTASNGFPSSVTLLPPFIPPEDRYLTIGPYQGSRKPYMATYFTEYFALPSRPLTPVLLESPLPAPSRVIAETLAASKSVALEADLPPASILVKSPPPPSPALFVLESAPAPVVDDSPSPTTPISVVVESSPQLSPAVDEIKSLVESVVVDSLAESVVVQSSSSLPPVSIVEDSIAKSVETETAPQLPPVSVVVESSPELSPAPLIGGPIAKSVVVESKPTPTLASVAVESSPPLPSVSVMAESRATSIVEDSVLKSVVAESTSQATFVVESPPAMVVGQSPAQPLATSVAIESTPQLSLGIPEAESIATSVIEGTQTQSLVAESAPQLSSTSLVVESTPGQVVGETLSQIPSASASIAEESIVKSAVLKSSPTLSSASIVVESPPALVVEESPPQLPSASVFMESTPQLLSASSSIARESIEKSDVLESSPSLPATSILVESPPQVSSESTSLESLAASPAEEFIEKSAVAESSPSLPPTSIVVESPPELVVEESSPQLPPASVVVESTRQLASASASTAEESVVKSAVAESSPSLPATSVVVESLAASSVEKSPPALVLVGSPPLFPPVPILVPPPPAPVLLESELSPSSIQISKGLSADLSVVKKSDIRSDSIGIVDGTILPTTLATTTTTLSELDKLKLEIARLTKIREWETEENNVDNDGDTQEETFTYPNGTTITRFINIKRQIRTKIVQKHRQEVDANDNSTIQLGNEHLVGNVTTTFVDKSTGREESPVLVEKKIEAPSFFARVRRYLL